jgi:hypothetical protein
VKTPIARVSRSRCSNDLRSSGGAAGALDSRAAVPAGADAGAGAGETAGAAFTFPFDRAGVAALGLTAGGGATGAAGSGAAAPLPCEVSGRGAGACPAGDAGAVLCPESGIAVRGFGDEQPQSASEAPRTERTSNLIPYKTGRRRKRSLEAGEHWDGYRTLMYRARISLSPLICSLRKRSLSDTPINRAGTPLSFNKEAANC